MSHEDLRIVAYRINLSIFINILPKARHNVQTTVNVVIIVEDIRVYKYYIQKKVCLIKTITEI